MQQAPHFAGIYASTIVPLTTAYDLDESALARHVASVTATRGLKGLLINGHAGETFVLSGAEKRHVVEIVRAAVGPEPVLIAGVNAEASRDAAAHAADAEEAGADAILVFPPFSWALPQDPDIAIRHHVASLDATRFPIMLCLAPVGAGALAYGPEQLQRLVALPRVVAIKEGSWETARYEANLRLVSALAPHVLVMPS